MSTLAKPHLLEKIVEVCVILDPISTSQSYIEYVDLIYRVAFIANVDLTLDEREYVQKRVQKELSESI